MTDDEYLALSPEEASRYWRQQSSAERKRLLALHLQRLKGRPPSQRGPRYLKRLAGPLILLVVFVSLIWGATSCAGRFFAPVAPISKAEEYPGPWQTATPPVYLAIYAQGHRCVEGYMRTSVKFRSDEVRNLGEYLVFCHEPTEVWTTYLVWLPSNRVLGPDRTFAYTSGVPLPNRHPDAVWMDTAP